MTLRQKQSKFAWDVCKLLCWLFENDYEITFGEAERTKEQQAIYLEKKLTKTMNSQHLKRLAIDINIFKNNILLTKKEDYKLIADKWSELDKKNVSGYDWGWDFRHFQRND
jgi:hypothetical protein